MQLNCSGDQFPPIAVWIGSTTGFIARELQRPLGFPIEAVGGVQKNAKVYKAQLLIWIKTG